MGYTTDFEGEIAIVPPLNEAEASYLTQFAQTRRMRRTKGPYFVGGTGEYGQGGDADIIDFNAHDPEQPGLWCQWVPTEDRSALHWDGNEKFYYSAEWMRYLIDHFLKPEADLKRRLAFGEVPVVDERMALFTFDHICDGEIAAQGEEPSDRWKLVVVANIVKVAHASLSYGEPVEL